MSSHHDRIQAVPTNVITGFLGVGKTTAILHLLTHKPSDERWAVLVNEFGEIGVDGSLFEGRSSNEKGVFIREVPGGCMLCLRFAYASGFKSVVDQIQAGSVAYRTYGSWASTRSA